MEKFYALNADLHAFCVYGDGVVKRECAKCMRRRPYSGVDPLNNSCGMPELLCAESSRLLHALTCTRVWQNTFKNV